MSIHGEQLTCFAAMLRLNRKSSAPRISVVLVAIIHMLLAPPAIASDCDPQVSPDYCQPANVVAQADPFRGVIYVSWQIYDSPLPDSVKLYRATSPIGNLQCGAGTNFPALATLNSSASGWTDARVTPGQGYVYCVCDEWSNQGEVCTASSLQALPSTPPPPPAQATAPSNLQVTDASSWSTDIHWQPRFSFTWRPGSNLRSVQLNGPSGLPGMPIQLGLSQSSVSYDVPLTYSPAGWWSALFFFKVCGNWPSNLCTNEVAMQFAMPPPPSPKAPVKLSATANSQHEVIVQFSPGDDDVTRGFQIQREDVDITVVRPGGNSKFWVNVQTVRSGPFGQVAFWVDPVIATNVRYRPVEPFTYRVCAFAGGHAPKTCSTPFQAQASRYRRSLPVP